MEWLFLLIAYLPVICIIIGLGLLIIGFVLGKSKKRISTGFFAAGGVCIGIFVLNYTALFLMGALGMGPAPT